MATHALEDTTGPGQAGGWWSDRRLAQDLVEHLGGELAGEGVLLARMERAEQTVGTERRLGGVPEPRTWPWRRVPERRQRPEDPVPRERAERHDRPQLGEGADLSLEVRQAPVSLFGGRFVPGRRTSVDRRDVGAPELK